MFYYWPMYRTFLLTHPYMMVAEDTDLEVQKYQKMGIGSRIVANIIGVPLGLAMGAMLWGTALSLLVCLYTCMGVINCILSLVIIIFYGIMLPLIMITIVIASIIQDLFRLIRPRNVIQPNHGMQSRNRG